jgi:hypothetical protein
MAKENADKESEQLSGKIKEIEFKQKAIAWVGGVALFLSSGLTWTGIIQPPEKPLDFNDRAVAAVSYERQQKENSENMKKAADDLKEAVEKLSDAIGQLDKQKPTPMPTPTIVIPSR